MVRALWILLCGFIALVFQGVLGRFGVSDTFIPQLMVPIVVFLSFTEVSVFGCCLVFVLGLLLDLSSAVLVGPWAGALVVLFGGLALLSQHLFIESGIAAMVITFFSVVATSVLFSLLGAEYPVITWEYPQKIFGQALTTALLAPLALRFISGRARRKNGLLSSGSSALSAV